ncbi:Sorting nexin, partial [Lachnellula occidentalis]
IYDNQAPIPPAPRRSAAMDNDDFANVSWQSDHAAQEPASSGGSPGAAVQDQENTGSKRRPEGPLGIHADALDLAGVGEGVLECTVTSPLKENDGSKDAYVSYLVTTNTTFPSFEKPNTSVRRRFTDFVFLYKMLSKEYPACAVPPLPDKHKMEYVRGDRFGTDFTSRRANSLHRFLARLALHPVLRRSALLIIFLESSDWNATMKTRPQRGSSASEQGAAGVFDNFTDTFINAFTKVHKPDKRFIEVREKSDKLDEDLGHVEKIVARVARREGDLETDYKDLAEQFQRLNTLEPGVEQSVHAFAASVQDTSAGMKTLRDHTDQDYLGSLRDMQAYSTAVKNLLKAREQKQLDFEQLTEYLTKSTSDRDILATPGASTTGTAGFIRSKIEDVRGVDHEQSRRERLRKLEMRIEDLTGGVEEAKKTTEAFDEEVVREVADFERIKRIEFKSQFGGLADAHVDFYGKNIEIWEGYVKEMENLGAPLA